MNDRELEAFLDKHPQLKRFLDQISETSDIARFADSKPKFLDIEDFAHALGRQVARQVVAAQVARQMQTSGETDSPADVAMRPCPTCGRGCAVVPRTRTIATRDGTVEMMEHRGYCSGCNRNFFPRSTEAGAAAGDLEPAVDAAVDDARRRRLGGLRRGRKNGRKNVGNQDQPPRIE